MVECDPPETCCRCGAVIQMMAFRASGVCSERCRKARDGDKSSAQAAVAGSLPTLTQGAEKAAE